MMYELAFDLAAAEVLDGEFALLAVQDYNCGDHGDWFWYFRRGLYGCCARLQGVVHAYTELHAWLPPRLQYPIDVEQRLATFFFCADSALECLVFAANALGNAVDPGSFRDCSDEKALARVRPENIIGTGKDLVPGYGRYFPTLQLHFLSEVDLVRHVMTLHDVSKHREMLYSGGRSRTDPPPGYYEALGVPDDPSARSAYLPAAEILLPLDPKAHHSRQSLDLAAGWTTLEILGPRFATFVERAFPLLLEDARANIPLKVQRFMVADEAAAVGSSVPSG